MMNVTSLDAMAGNMTSNDLPSMPSAGWGFWTNVIATPIIVFIGIIGNTLSFVVMKSKTLRSKSYSHYLCALAVFDTLNLIIRLVSVINDFYIEHFPSDGLFYSFNDVGCKLYKYIEHVAYLMSSWLVVLMAVERFTAVWFPFRKMAIRTQSGAAIAIVCLLILVCLSQTFRLEMVEHIQDTRTCAAGDEYLKIFTTLDIYFYQWTLTFFFPVVTVLVCNSLVIYQIIRVSGEVKFGEKDIRHKRAVRKKHHTTRMLLIVSFTFIFTLVPLLLLNMILDISIRQQTIRIAWSTYVYLQPYLQIAAAFSLVNYAVNFFIYILSGKCFRHELEKIFQKDRTTRSFTARSTRAEFTQL